VHSSDASLILPDLPYAGLGGDAVSVPLAAALAADANPSVLPAERLRLWHIFDVAKLEHGHRVGPKVKSMHGGYILRATVADGSRLPLEGIRINKRKAPNKQLSLNQCVFGVETIEQTSFSSFPLALKIRIAGRAELVAVTFTVTGEFAASS